MPMAVSETSAILDPSRGAPALLMTAEDGFATPIVLETSEHDRKDLAMRKRFLCFMILVAITGAITAACGGSSNDNKATATSAAKGADAASTAKSASPAAAAALPPNTLGAKKQAPASTAVDDAAWNGAAVMTVKTDVIQGTEATAPANVSVQALYSDTDVWFRFQWEDTTQDVGRPYIYDGSKWTLSSRMSDRISLLWPMTPIAGFEAKGCYAACHKPAAGAAPTEKPYMILPGAADKADNWQWTSESSAPVSQADDLRFQGVLADPKNIATAIVKDKLDSGGPVSNAAAAPAVGPVKMQDPAKKPMYGTGYLAASEAVPLDISKIKAGDTIPRRVLAAWVGSEGDIEAKHAYAGGKWTVVMHRKLDTGHDDDIKFVPAQSYLFELAVWNGIDHIDHTVGHDVYTLTFLK